MDSKRSNTRKKLNIQTNKTYQIEQALDKDLMTSDIDPEEEADKADSL